MFISALSCLTLFLTADLPAAEMPKVLDDRLKLELVLDSPAIATPTGVAVTEQGLVLVVENNTHFRPKEYSRSPHDRILALKDSNGDGLPDETSVFFEGTKNTMNLAVHPNGSIYVATRSEVFRLTDNNRDGRADQALDDREVLVRLDTKGDYPHNGLSGFAFDLLGNVYFGFGENLGAEYKIIGKDGVILTGGGEGGNIYYCRADGSQLRQLATGFWNPFHVGFDRFGRLFTVDNDPDARPPCRLLHVIAGGDYGFKFRNGRKGVHPFTAWNGELPGTLPMVAGTGEAPCAVVAYESDQLPEEYRGELLVTSWGDHRLERYRLKPRGASFTAEMQPLVVGGQNFRPVGLAIAPDGSLFMSDWVDKSYQLHGKGRVWRLSAKVPPKLSRPVDPLEAIKSPHGPTREAAARKLTKAQLAEIAQATNDPLIRSLAERKLLSDVSTEAAWNQFALGKVDGKVDWADPFVVTASLAQNLSDSAAADPNLAVIQILRDRKANKPERRSAIRPALSSANPAVQAVAVMWIGEERLTEYRADLEAVLRTATQRKIFELTLAALDMLDLKPGDKIREAPGAEYILKLLSDPQSPPEILRLCLRMIPANHAKLSHDTLIKLTQHADANVRLEAIRTLRERSGDPATKSLVELATDKNRSDLERAEAVIGLSADTEKHRELLSSLAKENGPLLQTEAARALRSPEPKTALPPLTDNAAWQQRLNGNGDAAAGERLFFHPKFASCYRCHEQDGRGQNIGPNLTALRGTLTAERLLQSLLEPSREIAPRYTPWVIETTSGSVMSGLYVDEEVDGTLNLADANGKLFKIHPRDIETKKPSPKSIMPEGLLQSLTEQEVRDLFAFLLQKPAKP